MQRDTPSGDDSHDVNAPLGGRRTAPMTADPVLARLVVDVDHSMAALKAYLAGEIEDEDLVPLRNAEREFHRSNDTVRRWAKEEGLGIEKDGRWYLRRSMVHRCKLR